MQTSSNFETWFAFYANNGQINKYISHKGDIFWWWFILKNTMRDFAFETPYKIL